MYADLLYASCNASSLFKSNTLISASSTAWVKIKRRKIGLTDVELDIIGQKLKEKQEKIPCLAWTHQMLHRSLMDPLVESFLFPQARHAERWKHNIFIDSEKELIEVNEV